MAAPARRGRVLLAVLVLVHLALISHQVDGGGGVSLLQRVILAAMTPVQRGVEAVVGGAAEAWRGYGFHRETYAENRRLEKRLRELEAELQVRAPRAQEVEQLRELLQLRKALPLDTVAAQVIGRDGVPWFRTLTLDRGERDGVLLDAPVISPTGVVGRVFAVGPHAARVQVLLDRDSGAGVAVERSRVAGVVSGQVSAPGDGRRRPPAQVRARPGGRRGRATSWSRRGSTGSTRRASWSAACASSARGRVSSATSASSPRPGSRASRRCWWSGGRKRRPRPRTSVQ